MTEANRWDPCTDGAHRILSWGLFIRHVATVSYKAHLASRRRYAGTGVRRYKTMRRCVRRLAEAGSHFLEKSETHFALVFSGASARRRGRAAES